MKYANHISYSDITPFEVLAEVSATTLMIREMDTVKDVSVKTSFEVGSFSAHSDNAQKWIYSVNPDNASFKIRVHKNGQWYDKYRNRYALSDTPRKFYDYNF